MLCYLGILVDRSPSHNSVDAAAAAAAMIRHLQMTILLLRQTILMIVSDTALMTSFNLLFCNSALRGNGRISRLAKLWKCSCSAPKRLDVS